MLGKVTTCVALLALAVEATITVTPWSGMDIDLQHEFANVLAPRQAATDLQTFTGALGGIKAPPITNTGDPKRPFQVGDSTFDSFKTAAQRSCDNQKNACAKVANDNNQSSGFDVGDCDKQKDKCKSAQSDASVTSFASAATSQAQVISSDDDFTYFCDP